MKMIVEYEGKIYESKPSEITAKESADLTYKNLQNLTKLFMELNGGGYLLLGKDAVQRCIIKILDTP